MRKLIATYACRNQGSRLYAKPMQNLDIEEGITILEYLINLTKTVKSIDQIVLGVSEGIMNDVFLDVAEAHQIGAIRGDERDVLQRLIQCVEHSEGTDAFRITTESPFFHYEMIDDAWQQHVANENDVTVIDGLPDGCNFEIFTLEALKRSHENGEDKHRSEMCSLYIRENRNEFKCEVLPVAKHFDRLDLRLTVDYPEDLILCRSVYHHFKHLAPRIPVDGIIEYIDKSPELKEIVSAFSGSERLWRIENV